MLKNIKFLGLCLALPAYLQADDSVTRATMQPSTAVSANAEPNLNAIHSLSATAPARGDTWIGLGRFNVGGHYTISVSAGGNSANSSAELKFSTVWGSVTGSLKAHSMTAVTVQNSFDFYKTKGRGDTGLRYPGHGWIYVFLKYRNNTSRVNNISITIRTDRASKWVLVGCPDGFDLPETDKIVAVMENRSKSNGSQVNVNSPLTVQGYPVLTQSPNATSSSSYAGGSASATNTAAFAYGSSTTAANGTYSMAFGANVQTDANASAVFGLNSVVNGYASMALGREVKTYGEASVALGWNTQAGDSDWHPYYDSAAFATGRNTRATGQYSTAMGYDSKATNEASFTAGYNNLATGNTSVAMGRIVTSSGYFSSAFGVGTVAQDRAQFVVGQYNKPVGNQPLGSEGSKNSSAADVLFVVGNGTGNEGYVSRQNSNVGVRSNALEVRQDGSTTMKGKAVIEGGAEISGSVTLTERQGDISMGIYGAQ